MATDWKGNEIKVGDTLVLYRTIPETKIEIHTGLTWTDPIPPFKQENKKVWRKVWEKEVTKFMGTEVVSFNVGEETHHQSLMMLEIGKNGYDVICIKGVSDSEQDYYTEYFKVK